MDGPRASLGTATTGHSPQGTSCASVPAMVTPGTSRPAVPPAHPHVPTAAASGGSSCTGHRPCPMGPSPSSASTWPHPPSCPSTMRTPASSSSLARWEDLRPGGLPAQGIAAWDPPCPHTSPRPALSQGDTRVFLYEVTPEPPYFLECNSFTSSDPHKVRGGARRGRAACPAPSPAHLPAPPGLRLPAQDGVRRARGGVRPSAAAGPGRPRAGGFPRASCQGSHRGWQRGGAGWRLPSPSPPRVLQKEYFQDDIFPPTRVWWEPSLSASAWLAGADGQQRRADLRPPDMTPGRSGGARRAPRVGLPPLELPHIAPPSQ